MRSCVLLVMSVLFVLPLHAEETYTYWVPAVASGVYPSGLYGARVNLVQYEPHCSGNLCGVTTAEIRFVPFGAPLSSVDKSNQFMIARGGMTTYVDVYVPGNESQSGYLHITTDSPVEVNATIERFRLGPHTAVSSQTLPVVESLVKPESIVVPGVIGTPETHYTNLFILNMDEISIPLTISFTNGHGLAQGEMVVELQPQSAQVLHDLTSYFTCVTHRCDLTGGVPDEDGLCETEECAGYLVITSPIVGSWYAFASRINRVSGDATTLLPTIH